MASNLGTLEALARQLALALQPLKDELSPAEILQRLAELGLALPPAVLSNPGFSAALSSTSNAAGALSASVTQLTARIESNDEAGIASTGAQVIQQLGVVFTSLNAIGPALKAVGPLAGVNAAELTNFADALPSRLLGRRVLSFLEDLQPSIVGIGNLLGVLDRVPKPGVTGDPLHPPFVLEQLQLGKLGDVLKAPAAILKSLYGWGESGFDGSLLMPRLATSLTLLGLPAYPDATGKALEAGFMALKVIPGPPPGISVTLSAPIMSGIDLKLPLTSTWSARTRAQGIFAAGLIIDITPPSIITMKSTPPGGVLNGNLSVDLIARSPNQNSPLVLLGQTGGSRLQTGSLSISVGLAVKSNAAEFLLRFEIIGGKVIINTGNADGFITKILGGTKLESNFDLAGDYSIGNGLHFQGSSGLEVQLASHVNLGPLAVNALNLSVGIKDGAFPIAFTADLQTSLGPLVAVVQALGFKVDVVLAAGNTGNLGPVDFRPGFQAPKGVGLSLDAGGFKGGGLLRFEPDKGEYSGTLELTFAEFISVRAVGILSTRLPDGADSFSLIIIIVSEFVPIQLSYGFTLLGVGGLLGLNRTVNLDALQVGVRDGTLNSILFPTDVVANAPRIISDLKRVFPPQEDRFLIGPMGKLGWGTPTLISLEIGLLLEIPRPGFAILGVLRVQLPAEEFGTLYIQVNFVGSVDFEKGQLQFDASLYNSRVLISPLTGDMALRIYWGGEANFLLTVGGFHPAYTPPPMNLGTLNRLGLVLSPGIPSVRAELYFALTSNTVQFGARVEVMYGVSFFNVFGFVGLDVLIQFNPFMFVAEISAMFGVRTGSTVLFAIQVTGTLKGPTPWQVRGEASFQIGFIIKVRLSADFEVTTGELRNTMLPPVDVVEEIRKAFDKVGNWRAVLPRGSNQHVSLRELPQSGAALVLHPFGSLEISQKVAPLNLAIQRLGASRPARGSVFKIAAAHINGADVATTASTEQFAPGQFFEMDDAAKLSRPSFARYDAGIVIGADDAPQTDFRRGREVEYEVIYLPEHHPVRVFFKVATTLFNAFARVGSAARSSLSQEARAPSPVAAEHVSLAPEQYAVVSTLDMTLHAAPLVFDDATSADQAVAKLIASHPELTGAVQVVPSAQIRRAA